MAGFRFFDNGDPANPFVAGERSEVVPFFEHGGMGGEDLFEVGRGWVEVVWHGGIYCLMFFGEGQSRIKRVNAEAENIYLSYSSLFSSVIIFSIISNIC